uniref:Lipoxygenase domain-containing protein n=1 Tax=Oryzias latipes TaxID=8090 RepID=A0A3B3HVK4_ORYLA
MTVEYQVTVSTEDVAFAGTIDDVYITLVGQDGSSEQVKLDKSKSAFHRGDVSRKHWFVCLRAPPVAALLSKSAAEVVFLQEQLINQIRVLDEAIFVVGRVQVPLGSGLLTAGLPSSALYCSVLLRWAVYKEGIPLCMEADTLKSLPPDDRYPYTRELEFNFTAVADGFWRTPFKNRFVLSDYAMKHWREDAFFGYQFLNGVNPMMIQRCKTLPSKFPVPLDMNFSKSQLTLRTEMMKGNIFLCDYNILDGVETNTINGRKQFLAAPLVLLHKNEDDEMMPIAIQLKQEPGEDNPIFFPTDSEYDWLLAKTYVKSADSNLHELNYHLLRTHLLAEVFAVSLQRNLPRVHPVYKLLIRHTRYTLQINVLARNSLISESGTITLVSELSVSSMSYRSLCIPDDIIDRGLEDVPNFYYRDDGLKLWNIMQRFVHGILSFYYKTDCMVQNDAELQNWIQEIFENGFLRCNETGIPQKFTTVAELVKFVTMVMFTCSAQHAAVNTGQYDLYGWMPNGPSTMQEPPPTHKGKADEASFLSTLPDVQTTVHILATVWLLSMQSSDARYLHDFVEEHFTEDFPKYKVTTFQRDLIKLSEDIKDRNENLKLPYTFLDPKLVENSVAI